MATNKPSGDNHRNGAVRKRSQVEHDDSNQYTKRNKENGQFIDNKGETKFKGVRKEK
ncbi:hypothetical protein [Bdellovibrio bacteriovorus]|uniref:hypothetical protein n=1 Tax=Bdellovibrio bacteriovorus TaxID=959 RepID=UPI000AAAE102|nr:hypothetical protein [Bdellovibrio bacteriovorus]